MVWRSNRMYTAFKLVCGCLLLQLICRLHCLAGEFRAGAAQVDITPTEFPVIVNGMVEERTAERAADALMSRALVLDDGSVQLAIVVVDSLMLPRELLDDVKQQAAKLTGIPEERMLISATHTHSAPSAMPCLGSRVDPAYAQFLPAQIARSIRQAQERLEPAEAGWAVVTDDAHNHCRRWIFRSDRMNMTDPFGVRNVRAHMHPGYQSAESHRSIRTGRYRLHNTRSACEGWAAPRSARELCHALLWITARFR